jgi:hypothetical protein
MQRCLMALGLALVLLLGAMPAAAGPVDWHEVPPTAAGRQWWDAGSLRVSRNGMLTVLSRFQPAAPVESADGSEAATTKPRILGDLYVMEIDCGQSLFRDTSVNGIPRWNADWQPLAGDGLIGAVVQQSCSAAGLLPSTDDPTA